MPRRLTALLASLLAIACLVGVTAPPAEAASRDRTAQEAWLEWHVADAINGVRGGAGLGAVTGWTDLRAFARDWAEELAGRGELAHNPAFADGYCCWQGAGEILVKLPVGDLDEATLAALPGQAVDAWMGSPGHRDQMLDGATDQLGVGVTIDHDARVAWVVVDFRDTSSDPPGSAWYRPGSSAPAMPPGGEVCGDDNAPYGATTWPLPTSSLTRVGGRDRVETALRLAGDTTPDTVVLASSATPFDALAGAGLAGTTGAAVLLTSPDTLDARVAERLRRWSPDEVVLLGGTGALSPAVASRAARVAGDATVTRLDGPNRYATAAGIADAVRARGGPTGRVVLAPGEGWADAVTVSGLAASHRLPVLLTAGGHLPSSSADALGRLRPSVVTVVGGAAVVSDAVLAQVRTVAPGARIERVWGADRYLTSRAVTDLDQQLRGSASRTVHVVHGGDWPDALTAGPTAARHGAVLALVDGLTPSSGGHGIDHVADMVERFDRLDVTLVGGVGAISAHRAAVVRSRLPCVR